MLDANDGLRDLSDVVDDSNGVVLSGKSLAKLRAIDPASLPLLKSNPCTRPCVDEIEKFCCIVLNFSDHTAKMGSKLPDNPTLSMKANSKIVGPKDTVIMPRGSSTTDWEIELGAMIGKTAKYVTKENALEYVAGYCVINDVSERTFQSKISGQWSKGKSCDTFGPTGPWLVTRDEVPDPQNLAMALDVNGKRMQTGNTSTMVFSVAELIEHLSGLFTLHPGDVISTGTPPGVGMGIKPTPVYLKSGDVMDLTIEGLGAQRQNVGQDD